MRRRNIVWTLTPIAMLLLSIVMVAKEKEDVSGYTCSPAKVAGTWGYSETGMAVIYDQTGKPLSTVPYASVGTYNLDAEGNISGERKASSGGTIIAALITGTATADSDCTGTLNLSFWDPSDPTKSLGSGTKFVVYINKATEAFMIITSTPITPYPPNGTGSLGLVLTTTAKKVSPGHGNED